MFLWAHVTRHGFSIFLQDSFRRKTNVVNLYIARLGNRATLFTLAKLMIKAETDVGLEIH